MYLKYEMGPYRVSWNITALSLWILEFTSALKSYYTRPLFSCGIAAWAFSLYRVGLKQTLRSRSLDEMMS